MGQGLWILKKKKKERRRYKKKRTKLSFQSGCCVPQLALEVMVCK